MVDGVGMAKTPHAHGRQAHATGQQLKQGGIIDIETFIDISNVQLVCPNCGQLTRVGHQTTEDGEGADLPQVRGGADGWPTTATCPG